MGGVDYCELPMPIGRIVVCRVVRGGQPVIVQALPVAPITDIEKSWPLDISGLVIGAVVTLVGMHW